MKKSLHIQLIMGHQVCMYAEIFVRGVENLSIFRESRPRPTCTTELTKIPWNFFSTGKEGKGTVKESKSVMDTPPYFERNSQINPMSLRGEPAATRFIVSNFTLPSP